MKKTCSICNKKLERVHYEIMVTYGNWELFCNKCFEDKKDCILKKKD